MEHYNVSQEFDLIAVEIKIKKQNREYTNLIAMIDTGASVSLIEERFIEQRNIEGTMITQEAVDIVAINQDVVKNNGKIEVLVKVGTGSIRQEMVVVSHYELPTPIVLGVNYLKRNNVELSIKTMGKESFVEVKINGEIVRVTPRGSGQRVTVIQTADKEETKEKRENNDDDTAKGTRDAHTGNENDKRVAWSTSQTTGSESTNETRVPSDTFRSREHGEDSFLLI